MATKLGAASLGEGCGTSPSDTLPSLFVLIAHICLKVQKHEQGNKRVGKEVTPIKVSKGKCRGEQAKQEERKIKKTEFNCQALKGLTKRRDDSCDSQLHKQSCWLSIIPYRLAQFITQLIAREFSTINTAALIWLLI